jgi:uncharacterized RDD family membrane protein YckC
MLGVMNAIAQVSAAPVSGSKLDNRRVMAAIVDLLIVTAGAVVVLIAGDSLTGDRQSALAAVILGWALYYFFALESGEGQTLGKKLMKLRVVRADGRPAGMREIGVRTILRVIDNYLVGLIVMLATGERRQRIGDLAAGTIVVDASGLAVAPPAPLAPVADDEVGLEPEHEGAEDEPEADPDPEPLATQTITLPPRPTPPATVTDLTEPEAEEDVAEKDVAEEEPVAAAPMILEPRAVPLVREPAEEEPAVKVEPEVAVEDDHEVAVEVEPEVAVEVEPEVSVGDAPELDDELPEVTSPSLEELADDVAAAQVEPEVDDSEAGEPEAREDDGPVNVKSVETVSAMDLIMGAAEEDSAAQESGPEDEEPSPA